LIHGIAKRIPMPSAPISAISGFRCVRLEGISERSSSGSRPCGVTPSMTWICLAKMMTPIAASIPCTTDEGKKSAMRPARTSPRPTCKTPAMTMHASVRR
jgi:hypothetical protein